MSMPIRERRRKPIPKQGKSNLSKIKRQIQAKLREKAIERDETCTIGKYPSFLPQNWLLCGSYRSDGELVVQAEHLVSRGNSASYGDMDNIVLLCKNHHIFFKKHHPALYWEIIRKHIGEERWAKVQKWEAESWKPVKVNFSQALEALSSRG